MKKEIYVLNGARTPMGEYNGKLSGFTEIDLGVIAAREAMTRSGVEPAVIDHVVFGNALQASGNAVYGARHVGLGAGVPDTVAALTVNRLCGSGIQSIITAAHMIEMSEAEIVLAGGMESMSQAPHVIRGVRSGLRLGDGTLEDSLTTALMDQACGLMMAQTADLLARDKGISRQDADAYALVSQRRAEEARRAGRLAEEIVPVEVPTRRGKETLDRDDHARPDTTPDTLATLKPAFGTELVTAGNASGIVDGAASVVVASGDRAAGDGLERLGRLVAWHCVGVPPRTMGIGPVPAIRGALERAGLELADIDLLEVNEAFAAQYLAVERELGLDRDRVNVNGGAIALGHPLGATGTRLVLTLLLELRRRHGRYGIASACIGGGQGIALVVESLD